MSKQRKNKKKGKATAQVLPLTTSKGGYKRCYESHPELILGGGTFVGGSCGYPVTKDADVYVGLDSGSFCYQHSTYPWEPSTASAIEFLFKITDMQAPPCAATFKKLIVWLAEQLDDGKKVHVGCIGGHGRTGTVLAALVQHVLGEEDAISWAREKYCKKAVESAGQVDFLHKHFGIKKIEASKSYGGGGGLYGGGYRGGQRYGLGGYQDAYSYYPPATAAKSKPFTKSRHVFVKCVPSPSCIWA